MTIIAVSGLLWGTSFAAMKVGLQYVDPYSFAFLRMLTAFLLSAGLLFAGEQPRVSVLRDRTIWIMGALNAAGFILQFVGILYTTATRTALIVNSNIVVTALLSWRLYREPMGAGKILALPLAVLGVFLLTTGGDLSSLSGGQALGDLLVLLSGIVWSFFIVLNKGLVSRSDVSVSQIVAWVMLVTAIGTLPFAFAAGDLGRTVIPWEGWVAVAYTAVFCTFMPYFLFNKGQRYVGATLASLVLLIEVAVAIVSSALILGEQLALGSGVGALLVCVAIVLASRDSG
jgi:drug/metabolite transporter (DMT)-like permease